MYFSVNLSAPENQAQRERAVALVAEHGGRIIQYTRFWSFATVTHYYPVLEWIPPGRSRIGASLKHAAFCGLFGWWSVTGWLATPFSILDCLMGGVDVTLLLTRPHSPRGFPDPEGVAIAARDERRQRIAAGALLALIFVGSMIFFVCVQGRLN